MSAHTKHIQAICKLLRACQYRHDPYILFSDCIETAAIALSNAVDHRQRDAREARYLQIVGRYDRRVVETFPKVLAEIAVALETERGDVLGCVFHDLDLHSHAKGQFFTPYTVARFMAEASIGERQDILALIEENGFVRAVEPACGAGAMVIALADALHAQDINYQRYLHVTAVDIDPRAIHMAYIQLSLLHVPAILVVGNALSRETQEIWHTPAHILGGWSARLAQRDAEQATPPRPPIVPAPIAPARRADREPPRQLSLF